LSFRDLARLIIVNETEIQTRDSPLLSGQYVSATSEYAAFKLLLTGTDDSALVSSAEKDSRRGVETGKIELLDQWIQELRSSLDESGTEEGELRRQLAHLESTIDAQNRPLESVQKTLNDLLERRGVAAREVRNHRARLLEIGELVGRFTLLDSHYESDLRRLEAIHESGSLLAYLDTTTCPLCGAEIGAQHLDSDCDGNTDVVVEAADAEMQKIYRLRAELEETLSSLRNEQRQIDDALPRYESEYRHADEELSQVAAPAVSEERASYNALITKRAEVQATLAQFERLARLIAQKAELAADDDDTIGSAGRTQISKAVLDSFSQTVQQILSDWHFPNAQRVFFDESKRDFQIAGKEPTRAAIPSTPRPTIGCRPTSSTWCCRAAPCRATATI